MLGIGLAISVAVVLAVAPSRIDEGPELVSEQLVQEAALEAKFFDFKDKYGAGDIRTLEAFFELFDLWIMLYRLNKINDVLRYMFPACLWRQDNFTIKVKQALAFTRWKQGRVREALAHFHDIEGWLGKSPALSENIGHTYNALGMEKEAEHYLTQALNLMDPKDFEDNIGGPLLGLVNVFERKEDWDQARLHAQQAYGMYKDRDMRRGWVSSLTAKAAMSLSKIELKLGHLWEAEVLTQEALKLFEFTSGSDSPLMVGAYKRKGEILMQKEKYVDAREAFYKAYQLEAVKDAFDLVEIVILHQSLLDAHLGRGKLQRSVFKKYFPTITQVLKRVNLLKQDGNVGAYYKMAAEFFVLGDDCKAAMPLLNSAISLLEVETSIDTKPMVKSSRDLISYCKGDTKHLEEQYWRNEL